MRVTEIQANRYTKTNDRDTKVLRFFDAKKLEEKVRPQVTVLACQEIQRQRIKAETYENLNNIALGETNWGSITARDLQPIQRGFSVFPDGSPIASNVKKVIPEEGFFDVAGHGSQTQMSYKGETGNLNARDLARIIVKHPEYNGENIRLLSCSTGKSNVDGEYCFAQDLSNALGVAVKAPNRPLLIGQNGQLGFDESDGEFVLFVPNQRRRIK